MLVAEDYVGADVKVRPPGGMGNAGHGQDFLIAQTKLVNVDIVSDVQGLQNRIGQDPLRGGFGMETIRAIEVADLHTAEDRRIDRQVPEAEQVDHRDVPRGRKGFDLPVGERDGVGYFPEARRDCW